METSTVPGRVGVLRTRLLPPRLPEACLPRPELVERLLAGAKGRLVNVVAGAGWGKSTLLAQALAGTEMACGATATGGSPGTPSASSTSAGCSAAGPKHGSPG